MKREPHREPLLTAGTVTGIITAGLGVAVAFGVDLDDTQTAAVLALTGLLAPLVTAAVARHWTTPSSTVVAFRPRHSSRSVAGAASPLPDGTPVGVTAVGPPVA